MAKPLRMLGLRLAEAWRRWRGRETTPTLIVSDMHIGTTMWQTALLRSIGVDAEARTLSKHAQYASSKTVTSDAFFLNLAEWSEAQVREEFARQPGLRKLRQALCSFPPSRLEALTKLPTSVKLILNIGHRIHISVAADRLEEVTRHLRVLAADPRYVLATMSEYDFHYTKYYTGVELRRLPVVCVHLAPELLAGPYAPANRIVLIGPSHNLDTIIGFANNLAALNQQSAAYAARHGFEPYTFEFIKKIYPGNTASPENLARHPAVLMNPYSAFSISMVELYQMNLPFFVPSDELLVDQMGDVRLHPIYQSQEAVDELERHHPVASTGYSHSPNDPSPEAQRAWLKYMYFNQVENAQRWSTPEELFGKLYRTDLVALHDRMKTENQRLFAEQAEAWARLLPSLA
jgi:hypothetical protein